MLVITWAISTKSRNSGACQPKAELALVKCTTKVADQQGRQPFLLAPKRVHIRWAEEFMSVKE